MQNVEKQMTGFTVLALAWLLSGACPAPDTQGNSDMKVNELLEKAEQELAKMDEPAAIGLFEKILEFEPLQFDALWNVSLLYSKEGHRQERERDMRRYYEKARERAGICLEHYTEQAACHYVFAVAEGRIADISRARDRVRASKLIKTHIDRTLEIDPGHKGGWHLLGVWHASVANLSRSERWAANLLFGGAPEGASNRGAEEALLKAVELDPDNILFNLDLARFYKETGRKREAAEVLESILQMEMSDRDDPANLKRAQAMLDRLQ